MKRFSKILVIIFIALITLTVPSCGSELEKSDIVIIYTTDVHCGVDDNTGAYVGIEGQRRVKNVMVSENGQYVEIDPNRQYTITATNFILSEGGDGANMFMDCEVIAKNVMLDSEALIKYIFDVLQGNLKDSYGSIGDRITIE